MKSVLWKISDGAPCRGDQASPLHALGGDKWDDCGSRKEVDCTDTDDVLCGVENELDAQPILQMANVPFWIDDALFGHLDSVLHSPINQKTSEEVEFGPLDGVVLSSNGKHARFEASAASLVELSPFHVSDRLPGILPQGMQLEQLRTPTLNLDLTARDCVAVSASSDSAQILSAAEYPMAACKLAETHADDIFLTLPRSGSLGEMRLDQDFGNRTPGSRSRQPVIEMQRAFNPVEEILDFTRPGSGGTHFPQIVGNLPHGQGGQATMKYAVLNPYKEPTVRAACDPPTSPALGSMMQDRKHIQLREPRRNGPDSHLLAEDQTSAQLPASWHGSSMMHDYSDEGPRRFEREQCHQLISKEFSTDINMVASIAPPSNDELTGRQNGAGSDSGVKSEDVKLQRAQRNRESAKRSRLKSKLLHQKMTATYDRLRDENRALKGLVERLVEECRSAPREVQDRLRTIIHEKQSMKDKQGTMHGVLY
jgi:hypothetical protein